MQLIAPSDFKTQAWKNGGGITHEIARDESADRLLWRFSIAEVASDGPFSLFPGLARILTVIDGAGIDLTAADSRHRVLPLQPFAFSGDTPITGRLCAGPIRDFNVIFDPAEFTARVTVLRDEAKLPLSPRALHGVLLLAGHAMIDGATIALGGAALCNAGTLSMADGAIALLADLDPK